MFKQGKYKNWYDAIIKRAELRPSKKISGHEWHHPIPKSLGGDPKVKVQLTPREHCICHMLLVRMTNGEAKSKMSWALHRMLFSKNDHQHRYAPTSRTYDNFRKTFYAEITGKPRVLSETHRANIVKANSLRKGRKESDVTRAKHRANRTGSTLSQEHKSAISAGHIGKILSTQHKENIKLARLGTKLSEETKKKISEAGKGRTLSPEAREKISQKAKARWAARNKL